MADLINRGMQWLQARRHKGMSVTVTVQRSGETDITPAATVGFTRFESQGYEGIIEQVTRDYIFRASDYGPAWATTEPLVGDLIVEGGSTYVVIEPAGRQPWSWSDPYGLDIRVHTTEVV